MSAAAGHQRPLPHRQVRPAVCAHALALARLLDLPLRRRPQRRRRHGGDLVYRRSGVTHAARQAVTYLHERINARTDSPSPVPGHHRRRPPASRMRHHDVFELTHRFASRLGPVLFWAIVSLLGSQEPSSFGVGHRAMFELPGA